MLATPVDERTTTSFSIYYVTLPKSLVRFKSSIQLHTIFCNFHGALHQLHGDQLQLLALVYAHFLFVHSVKHHRLQSKKQEGRLLIDLAYWDL